MIRHEVRLTPVIGGAILTFGVLSTLLGLWAVGLGLFSPLVFLGPVFIVLGVVQWRRVYFRVDHRPGSGRSILSAPGQRGRLAEGVTAAPGERFAVENGRIVHVAADGTRTPTPARRWPSRSSDWRALTAALEAVPPQEPSEAPESGA
ncbi:hypothetical protein PWG71_07400 [Nocardiopsis sp. N85]|uniref:hypothetical protein n=1 Tax=Nocardiopsis sp. N85 TaxID=3029400 RepID=UPI00237F7EE0|nr:hypothetical protein [Nocardiopsis sp. N85]MDE3721210.1 hypothetical protein [Nocardiopsis sp. N85]